MNRNQARRLAAFNAKKAAEHFESRNYIKRIDNAFTRLSEGCSKRVAIAASAAEGKGSPEYQRQLESRAEALERSQKRNWNKQPGERGVTCSGRQKMKLSSKPLI
ncbi:transcriptional regulator [Pluralibacter gergoviae]